MPSAARIRRISCEDVGVLPAHELRPGLDDGHLGCRSGDRPAPIRGRNSRRRSRSDAPARRRVRAPRYGSAACAASRPGTSGIAACVPRLRKTWSPVSVRVPPSFRLTSSVFGATKRPLPMINSAPLVLIVLQMRGDQRFDHVALALTNLRHVDLDGAGYRAELRAVCARDARPRRYGSRSCSACTRYWDRSRRSICARRRRSVVPIAPYARPSACRRRPLPRIRTS